METRRFKTNTVLSFVIAAAATVAVADDAALYDTAIPADAAFVRLLSTDGNTTLSTHFAGRQFVIGADLADAYIPVSAAQLSGVAAGSYFSIVAGDKGTKSIAEPPRETAAKIHLLLVNTGPDAVRLVVPEQNLEVVATIGAGQAASRAVNPIDVTLAVERVHDSAVLGVFDVSLSRGQNLSFVVDHASARLIENRFGPTRSFN